ncbi:hypothetical protein QBC40DRAFT_311178 [Triangularia verruculosa]|uniref:Uncharacterized protein n=1 Tax=Triangularia verruculosa TaxID=2587418 RepID=A0AAN7AQJ8_9PEZI|nr:hypothetical protein QBC40DRAFT_311178 [Triangularia verruculosa]
MVLTRNSTKAATIWNRHMRGTESLWYFGTEHSRAIRFESQQYFQANDYTYVFVPVHIVLGLGSSPLASRTASIDDDDPESNASQEKPSIWIDEELIENTPTDWEMSKTSITSMPEIDVRLENGSQAKLQIKVQLYQKGGDSWSAYVRTVLSLGSGKSYKPTRQCDMPLENPLLIQPLYKRDNLLASRFEETPDSFLLRLIGEANKSNADNKQTTDSDDGRWTLELYNEPCPGYRLMSYDPFYFYATWIHEDDWHSYMTMLGEMETTPIRKFISLDDQDAYEALNGLLLKVGERDLKIQGGLTDAERKAFGLDSEQAGHDKATANELRGRKIGAALKEKRLQGIGSQVKTYDFDNGQPKIEITLEEAKMTAASGKRAAQLTQAAVMGGVSASDVARGLRWETQRLASGFFSSEWLHLAAFSWGGFELAGAKSGFSTSQNLENLVFGTSETNSLMTRYEMAWQDFYRTEKKLYDKMTGVTKDEPIPPQGRLEIHCNNFSQAIRYDFYNGTSQKYEFGEYTIDKTLVNEIERLAEENSQSQHPSTMCALCDPMDDHTQKIVQDSRTPEVSTTERQMLLLAHDFPYVVYSIEYKVKNEFVSILFDEKPCATFSFYPFQRSLYHQAEAVLDALVWREIKNKAYEWEDLKLQKRQAVEAEAHKRRGNPAYAYFRQKLSHS